MCEDTVSPGLSWFREEGPWGWRAPGAGGLGLGEREGRVALTKKLLSLGLVARLRPRRMLSFRSDTLDRVTLPGMGGRSSACSPPACPPAYPPPRVCCSRWPPEMPVAGVVPSESSPLLSARWCRPSRFPKALLRHGLIISSQLPMG